MNEPDIFNFDFADDTTRNTAYKIIGKALTVACEFERDCKSYTTLLVAKYDIKSINGDRGEEIKIGGKEYHQRLTDHFEEVLIKHINFMNSLYKKAEHKIKNPLISYMSKELTKLLNKARISRNYIAHNNAVSIRLNPASQKELAFIIKNTKTHIKNIAEASKVIKIFLSLLTHEVLPTDKAQGEWVNDTIDWVVNTE